MASGTERVGSGKLILITGCTGGIGKASAIALARLGYSIAVHYHTAQSAATELVRQLTTESNVNAVAFQADLSSYDGARKLHAEVVERIGHPDVLFNNSGVTGPRIGAEGDVKSVDVTTFEEVWRTNVGTHVLVRASSQTRFKRRGVGEWLIGLREQLTQLCLPHMEEQKFGRVIFNSSVAAGIGGVVGPHYASSKSAMHGLVHWMALRYAKEGITCNAVAPALIADTGMMGNAPEHVKRLIPVGRFGLSEEVADIVVLLVKNAYMTNKIIVVDGGMTPSAF